MENAGPSPQTAPLFYYWRSQRVVREIQDKLSNCDKLIVYDLETTGTNPLYHRVIEIAAIRLKKSSGKFVEEDRLHQYIRLPDYIPLPEEITDLTGITPEKLLQHPFEDECLEDIMFFFEDTAVAGYNNLGFDDIFMRQYFYRNGSTFSPRDSFDVFMMARDFVSHEDVKNFKLETIANQFGIEAIQYHAAFSDAEVTVELLNRFMLCYKNDESAAFCGTQRPQITRVAYWGKAGQETEKGNPVHRIYVTLKDSETSVFYDIIGATWYTQSQEIDMDWLEAKSWEIVGAADENTFRSFRGKKQVKNQAA